MTCSRACLQGDLPAGSQARGVVAIVGWTGQIAPWQRAVLVPLRPPPGILPTPYRF